MSDITTETPAPEPRTGHGHTVEITLPNGQKRQVPWGFTDPKKEEKAAKKHGCETPGTTEGE